MSTVSTPPDALRRRLPIVMAAAGMLALAACATSSSSMMDSDVAVNPPSMTPAPLRIAAPDPDPRVGLDAGLFDAEEAVWNLDVVSETPPTERFISFTNSDLAFKDHYVFQGNYNGIQIWDIANPARPRSVITYVCPASQSDVSVYGDLLFVSGEGMGGRLDCGTEGVDQAASQERLRGIRIFDISDLTEPRYISNVQTCRGSHTHTLLKDPNDDDNVYVYVSGSAPVRPETELSGCSGALPSEDPSSALFRIEVIRVPLAHPEDAAIVNSPRIFEDLVAPPEHGLAPEDLEAMEEARAQGAFIMDVGGQPRILRDRFVAPLLDSIVAARGGTAPSAADSAALRGLLPVIAEARYGGPQSRMGPTQCHDITVYPHIGRAGGACGGYGLLLDISNPTNPRRLYAVSDSNFSYWHSATFNNDGTQVLFTDEWGGGGGPKCRATDPYEWGADAVFTIEDGGELEFHSYYKMSAPQTSLENCVAHNGSLIPIPGRDVMVQSWYQGGVSIFDWTDPENVVEIAFHDRGPIAADHMESGGTWSAYWYRGYIYSSAIARGLDVFELSPSEALSENEIEAARSVVLDRFNSQGQPHFEWPHTFALAGAYLDQIERERSASRAWIDSVRSDLAVAEGSMGSSRNSTLNALAGRIESDAPRSADPEKMGKLADAIRGLAGM